MIVDDDTKKNNVIVKKSHGGRLDRIKDPLGYGLQMTTWVTVCDLLIDTRQ